MCCEDIIPNPVKDMIPYKMGEYYSGTNEDDQYDSPGNLYNSQYPMYETAHEMEKAITENIQNIYIKFLDDPVQTVLQQDA